MQRARLLAGCSRHARVTKVFLVGAVVLALSAGFASGVAASETAYAQTDVAVHSSPSSVSRVLAQLAPGDPVISHGAEGDWVNIDVDVGGKKTNGWVPVGTLSPTEP